MVATIVLMEAWRRICNFSHLRCRDELDFNFIFSGDRSFSFRSAIDELESCMSSSAASIFRNYDLQTSSTSAYMWRCSLDRKQEAHEDMK